jgi:multidrug resistance efflux pump
MKNNNFEVSANADLTVLELTQRYSETIEELERFSQINPRDIVDHEEMENAENALLDYEAYLLGRATKISLKTEADINAMMDLWSYVSKSSPEVATHSNKIVMNIFRHMGR